MRKLLASVCILLFALMALPNVMFARVHPTKQQAFIEFLTPKINEVIQSILDDRARILKLQYQYFSEGHLSFEDEIWLKTEAENVKFNNLDLSKQKAWNALLERIDVLPPSLILAQAINESAWGRSRFAKLGNNYFGQWCHTQGCGIVPKRRPKGRTYEVKRFSNAIDSITSYLTNLNAHTSYQQLRHLRAKMRAKGGKLDSLALAQALGGYSIRRKDYVKSIKAIINHYKLARFDKELHAL